MEVLDSKKPQKKKSRVDQLLDTPPSHLSRQAGEKGSSIDTKLDSFLQQYQYGPPIIEPPKIKAPEDIGRTPGARPLRQMPLPEAVHEISRAFVEREAETPGFTDFLFRNRLFGGVANIGNINRETLRSLFVDVPKNILAGTGEGASMNLKGAPVLIAALDRRLPGFVDAFPVIGPSLRTIQPRGIDPTKNPLFSVGEAIEEWVEETIPRDPTDKFAFITQDVPRGIGQTLFFMLGGPYGAPALGIFASAGEAYDDVLQNGGTVEEAMAAASDLATIVAGASEALPIAALYGRGAKVVAGKLASKGMRNLQAGMTEAVEEGVQEMLQTVLINYAVTKNAPHIARDLMEGMWGGGGVGGVTGFLMGFAMNAVAGRVRTRKVKQMAEELGVAPEELEAFIAFDEERRAKATDQPKLLPAPAERDLVEERRQAIEQALEERLSGPLLAEQGEAVQDNQLLPEEVVEQEPAPARTPITGAQLLNLERDAYLVSDDQLLRVLTDDQFTDEEKAVVEKVLRERGVASPSPQTSDEARAFFAEEKAKIERLPTEALRVEQFRDPRKEAIRKEVLRERELEEPLLGQQPEEAQDAGIPQKARKGVAPQEKAPLAPKAEEEPAQVAKEAAPQEEVEAAPTAPQAGEDLVGSQVRYSVAGTELRGTVIEQDDTFVKIDRGGKIPDKMKIEAVQVEEESAPQEEVAEEAAPQEAPAPIEVFAEEKPSTELVPFEQSFIDDLEGHLLAKRDIESAREILSEDPGNLPARIGLIARLSKEAKAPALLAEINELERLLGENAFDASAATIKRAQEIVERKAEILAASGAVEEEIVEETAAKQESGVFVAPVEEAPTGKALERPAAEPVIITAAGPNRHAGTRILPAERFAFGTWDHEKNRQVGEGDIRKSYSADKLAENKIRTPFKLDGASYVQVGGSHLGDESSVRAYQVVPLAEFEGETHLYGEVDRGYHGQRVKRGKGEFVLVGPPISLETEGFAAADMARRKELDIPLRTEPDLVKTPEQAQADSPTSRNPITSVVSDAVAFRDLQLDAARFQARETTGEAFAEKTAASIENESNPAILATMDPITVWQDARNGKVYILDGHSRYEGLRRRLERDGTTGFEGDNIPVQFLKGSEHEAIDFAFRANALATAQSPMQNAAVLRRMREQGESKNRIQVEAQALFGKNSRKVIDLSHISPTGKLSDALKLLDQTQSGEREDVETMAEWIGALRGNYPQLTDAHENEIFDYLKTRYKVKEFARFKGRFVEHLDEFIQRSGLLVGAEGPLNLESFVSKSAQQLEAEKQVRDAEKELADARAALEKAREAAIKQGLTGRNLDKVLVEAANLVEFHYKKLLQVKEEFGRTEAARKQQSNLFGMGISFDFFKPHVTRTPLNLPEAVQSSNPVVEEQLAKAAQRGTPQPMIDTIRESAKKIWASTTRSHFTRNLDPNIYAKLTDQLRIQKQAPDHAVTLAGAAVHDVTQHLGDPAALTLFSRVLAARDTLRDIDLYEGRHEDIPFWGKTDQGEPLDVLRTDLARWEALAAENPIVAAALERREALVYAVVLKHVELGLLPASSLNNVGEYWHRKVLEYMDTENTYEGLQSSDVRQHTKGFQRSRVGGGEFSLRYHVAEFEWLSQAFYQQITAETLDFIDRNYNVAAEHVQQARNANEIAAVGGEENWLRIADIRGEMAEIRFQDELDTDDRRRLAALGEELRELDPTMPARAAMVKARKVLEKMALRGDMANVPPHLAPAVEDLIRTGLGEDDIFYYDDPGPFWQLMNYLSSSPLEPATGPARAMFKALALKESLIKEHAGNEWVNWRDVGSKSFLAFAQQINPDKNLDSWQPEKGRFAFEMFAAPRQLVERLAEEGSIPIADLKLVKAIGPPRPSWLLPAEVAQTLEEFIPPKPRHAIERQYKGLIRRWKQWTLINPTQGVKYNLNNLSGDADIVYAFGGLKFFRGAVGHAKNLWKWQIQGGERVSPEVQKRLDMWDKLALINSGFRAVELPNMDRKELFQVITGEHPTFYETVKRVFVEKPQDFTQWRENVLRLTAGENFLQMIAEGKRPVGVSKKHEMAQLWDEFDKGEKSAEEIAAKLGRELVGDYGNMSHAGEWLREHTTPFFSWMEINTPRYWRLLRNAPTEEGVTGAAASIRVMSIAARKAITFFVLLHAYNAAMISWYWDDEISEEDLEQILRARRRAELITPFKRDDGTIRTIRLQGAFSDMLDWFNASDIRADWREIQAGEKNWSVFAKEAALSPIEKMYNGSFPFAKTAIQGLWGYSYYPNLFDVTMLQNGKSKTKLNPRVVRDRKRVLADLWSLEYPWDVGMNLYRKSRGLPERPVADFGDYMANMLTYRVDPGQINYWSARSLAIEWSKRNKDLSPPSLPNERGMALYWYRRSVVWGDSANAEAWLQHYLKPKEEGGLGGNRAGLRTSLRNQHPVSVPRAAEREYIAGLSAEQKQTVARGMAYYTELFEGGQPGAKTLRIQQMLGVGSDAMLEREESVREEFLERFGK